MIEMRRFSPRGMAGHWPLGAVAALGVLCAGMSAAAHAASACDQRCLEHIADEYRAAYLKHDPRLAPIASTVRFTENNVEMAPFPDGSWDTVTQEIGPALTFSDPSTGNVGIYTSIMQRDTPGFLAIRLEVENGQITQIEHILSTKRNLSGPPTPIGDVRHQPHEDAHFTDPVAPKDRVPRSRMIALANGYFSTLQMNDGEIRGTRFSPDATRYENGLEFEHIEQGFKSGFYRFNDRVRDRDFFLVDESRGIVMSRGFIDHKGVLDEYVLTDGQKRRSVYREPHTWAFLEAFKIKDGMIVSVESTFIGAPYYMRSPWTLHPDRR
jgi:hypothetical protein